MKKLFPLIVLAVVLSASACLAADGLPLSLAGYTLGKDVMTYKSHCEDGEAIPMSDMPFLTEAHLRPDVIPGIRGGSLIYGNCLDNRLVRIKLKFHDQSQKLFDKLLKKYTAAFGKPDSYQGDTFKNVIAWQWDFAKGDQSVTVLLMWSRDNEMRPGVSIKMTLNSLLDAEYACYKEVFAREEKDRGGPTAIRGLGDFVPR